jgi:hypothetical protein
MSKKKLISPYLLIIYLRVIEIENDRMRVLGLHTIINDLPDAHYATLKYIMRHLDK